MKFCKSVVALSTIFILGCSSCASNTAYDTSFMLYTKPENFTYYFDTTDADNIRDEDSMFYKYPTNIAYKSIDPSRLGDTISVAISDKGTADAEPDATETVTIIGGALMRCSLTVKPDTPEQDIKKYIANSVIMPTEFSWYKAITPTEYVCIIPAKYVYGGTFGSYADIDAAMASWYFSLDHKDYGNYPWHINLTKIRADKNIPWDFNADAKKLVAITPRMLSDSGTFSYSDEYDAIYVVHLVTTGAEEVFDEMKYYSCKATGASVLVNDENISDYSLLFDGHSDLLKKSMKIDAVLTYDEDVEWLKSILEGNILPCPYITQMEASNDN